MKRFDSAYLKRQLELNQRLAMEAENAAIRDIHEQHVRMYSRILATKAQSDDLEIDPSIRRSAG